MKGNNSEYLTLKILGYKNFSIQKFKHDLENNTYIHFFSMFILTIHMFHDTLNIKKKYFGIHIHIFVPDSSVTEDFQDPLLELVIASENTNDPETLLEIAKRAAAGFETETSSKINLQILEQFTMTKIPMEEKVNVTRKQYFVESSDNDFGGNKIIFILDNEFIKFNLMKFYLIFCYFNF